MQRNVRTIFLSAVYILRHIGKVAVPIGLASINRSLLLLPFGTLGSFFSEVHMITLKHRRNVNKYNALTSKALLHDERLFPTTQDKSQFCCCHLRNKYHTAMRRCSGDTRFPSSRERSGRPHMHCSLNSRYGRSIGLSKLRSTSLVS